MKKGFYTALGTPLNEDFTFCEEGMREQIEQQIAAGHSDDTALTVSEELGWGWLADRGVDLIQTDWPMMLIDYLKRTQKYYKVKT